MKIWARIFVGTMLLAAPVVAQDIGQSAGSGGVNGGDTNREIFIQKGEM